MVLSAERFLILALALVFSPALSGVVVAQANGARNTVEGSSGLPTLQPVLPVELRREFGALDVPIRRRPGEPTMADFVHPPKGNDAVIEVVVGQGRLLTLKKPIATDQGTGVVAIGDPTVVDFEILPNPQMIRVMGRRAGATDLTVVTADSETVSFEISVLYDLDLLRAQLARLYPDSAIKISQLREHLILEGEARTAARIAQIEDTVRAFVASMQAEKEVKRQQTATEDLPSERSPPPDGSPQDGEPYEEPPVATGELAPRPDTEVKYPAGQIINLMRVPGVQQVLLQVRVAELNRTGLREIGADLLIGSSSGNFVGTNLTGTVAEARAVSGLGGFFTELLDDVTSGSLVNGDATTAFGIFPTADVGIFLRALRENGLISILAEPNLVAMSGHEASFLAGGQFPVPVPQGSGQNAFVTIVFKDFGVQLRFVPYVVDAETVRLHVAPEVSTIDESLGTTLVQGGLPVPGINTRRVSTTVEMRQGETLALAGLLQVELDAKTSRIPGLGDLPYIGPMFSNTSHERQEKELLVLVTPFLVSPLPPGADPAYPGQEVTDPNDKEFYLLNRIEGRTGEAFRSTTAWDDPWHFLKRLKLENHYLHGPVGYSR
jgi:pilus assembly protein CpaC